MTLESKRHSSWPSRAAIIFLSLCLSLMLTADSEPKPHYGSPITLFQSTDRHPILQDFHPRKGYQTILLTYRSSGCPCRSLVMLLGQLTQSHGSIIGYLLDLDQFDEPLALEAQKALKPTKLPEFFIYNEQGVLTEKGLRAKATVRELLKGDTHP